MVGQRVRIYVGESDQSRSRPLYLALLELLRAEGCAGATVVRGIAGFGANSRIHTATVLRLSEDLPIVVEWVDTPERVERVLPKVVALVSDGLVTVDEVRVVRYSPRTVGHIAEWIAVGEVMTRDVATVTADVPLQDAVELLLAQRLRALPVVDAGRRVIGILTGGDLVERGRLGLRVELLRTLSAADASRELRASAEGMTVAEVMTRDPVTISPATSLADAAHLMVTRRLKRLPVVDGAGTILGIVSRVDLLRTASSAFPEEGDELPTRGVGRIGDVIRTDVPKLRRGASLSEVLDAVISTRLNQALVLDEAERVVGVVSDAELATRLSPKDHPSVVRVLMSRLPFGRLAADEQREIERSTGVTAEALMNSAVTTVQADTPIVEAVATMIRERMKLLPVVDAEGRLRGAVDRADLLRLLLVAPRGDPDEPADGSAAQGEES